MATTRWTLEDALTGDVFTFPINPRTMTSPIRQGTAGTTAAGVRNGANSPATILRRTGPTEVTISGFIRNEAHKDALDEWCSDAHGKVLITDHLGRTFECFLQDFLATERKTNRVNPDRWTYDIKALVLRQTA